MPSIHKIHIQAEKKYELILARLPWHIPLEEWRSHGIRHLDIKRGIGRHPVAFVQVGTTQFVVKELGYESALREVRNYRTMLEFGIHTLVPVGCVARTDGILEVDTPVGLQHEKDIVGYSVTLLVDRVLPDSQLYRRAFAFENRKRIWDSIVDLFVELHAAGVYWGDASLANTLVKFLNVEVPYVGRKTRLRAYLADAETVEIYPKLSDALRKADVDFFLESMNWVQEDLRASGVLRDPMATEADRGYISAEYERMYDVNKKTGDFERLTEIKLLKSLGIVRDPAYLEILQKHIEEHKWYLGEREGSDVPTARAAEDWLKSVFVPMCLLFKEEGVMTIFPHKTASELYVEIMTNKYYLSRAQGSDVGMVHATRDYMKRFGRETIAANVWRRITRRMVEIFGRREQLMLGAMMID